MPPRNVQAPRPRSGGRTPDDARRRTMLFALAGSGVGLLVVVVAYIALSGGGSSGSAKGISDGKVAPLMKAAACTFKTVNAYVPKGQGTHVNSLTQKLPWNTDPPSNGQHYPAWAVWGFYTEPVNPRQVVHNEEHGGVIIWWGTKVSQATVTQLRTFYDEKPDGSFGTPYANLGSKVAITAWTGDPTKYQLNGYFGQGHIGVCPTYNAAAKAAFEAFRNAYRGHAPEGTPLSQDKPGHGPAG
ncbi:MAG: DUF3105 domain-containing protein [Gaiellaceae bacterium]